MKKYISLIMSFLLVLILVNNIYVYADESQNIETVCDETEKAYEEAANLFSALGIRYFVDDGWNSKVIRRDFICTLMQIMGLNNVSSSDHSFKDIGNDAELNSAVGHAVSLGIVSDADLFRPYDNITCDEAYKMCVVAVGYALEAQLKGGYPIGYRAVASSLKLTDGQNGNGGEFTSGDALLLLKNLGDTPIRRQSVFGDVNEYITNDDITFFSYYRGLVSFDGIVMANELTSVYDPDDCTKHGYVRIGEDEYKCSFSVMVGSRVEGYYLSENGINEIVYISDYQTKVLRLDGEKIESVSSSQIVYSSDEEKSAKLRYEIAPVVIYNTKAVADFSQYDLTNGEVEVILLENDGDSIYDAVHIRKASYMVVDRTDVYYEYIFDINGGMLNLGDGDTIYSIVCDDEYIKLSDVASGSVLTIYASADNKSYEIFVTAGSAMTMLTERSDDTLYAGDTAYRYNSYFEEYYLHTISLNKNYNFAFDANGRICAIISGSDVTKFAYVIGYAPAIGLGKPMLKLFTQSGEFLVVDIENKTSVNGIGRSREEVEALFYADGVCKNQIIQYNVNADGKLTRINVQKEDTGILQHGEGGIKRYIPSQSTLKYRSNGIFGGKFLVGSSTVFFNVNPDDTLSDEKRYAVGNPFISTNDYAMSGLELYNLTDDMTVGAVVYKNYGGAKINFESSHGVIERVSYAVTDDESVGVKVCMYSSGGFREYFITDETVIKKISTGNASEPWTIGTGDYVRYSLLGDKEITDIVKDYDYKTNTVINYGTDIQGDICYCIGNVYEIGSGYIVIIPHGEEPTEYNRTVLHATSSNIVTFDRTLNRLQSGSRNDIITYKDSPELCTPVLVRLAENYYSTMVVYAGTAR